MRISPHVYNDEEDVDRFVTTFRRLTWPFLARDPSGTTVRPGTNRSNDYQDDRWLMHRITIDGAPLEAAN